MTVRLITCISELSGYIDKVALVASTVYYMNKTCQDMLDYNRLDIVSKKQSVILRYVIRPDVNSNVMLDASRSCSRCVNSVMQNHRHGSSDVRLQLFLS